MKYFICLIMLFSLIAQATEPTLIGGRVARPGEWPEVIYISSGRSRCSATVISKNVIITAAHCISDGGDIGPVAEFVVNQTAYKAKCTHHPDYKNKYSFDFALCKTNQDINVKYASIANEPVELGEEAYLMGYGCTQPRKPDGSQDPGGNDGKLRYGKATINRLPGNGVGGGQYWETSGNTALCFGDSGGPAMKLIEDIKEEPHEISGINSRGDIRRRSLLSATYLPGFQKWAKAYAMANDVKICGINKDCINDDPDPKPDPDPDDPKRCIEERYKVWKFGNLLNEWKEKLETCESAAETLPYPLTFH